MQNLCYEIGSWHAQAELAQVGTNKLLAVISVHGNNGQAASRHTVVFDHVDGQDANAETEALVRKLLHERYGI